MALTVYYADPQKNLLANDDSNTNLPIETRNFADDVFASVRGRMIPDTSYPTGGWSAPTAKFGLKALDGVFFEDVAGYAFVYNKSTDKIQAYSSGGTEVANLTNISATVPSVYFRAEGRQY